MEAKKKDDRRSLFGIFVTLVIFAILGVIIASIMISGNAGAERQEQELQAIVEEIMIDIENKDFDAAYIKANSLYWDDSWTSEGEDKWDAIREEVLKQIESAENESNGNTSNSIEQDDTDKGIFNWFD